ncbi:MAG TPA: hypothetical protein VF896_01355, partial [Anaerolineales bacterium]
MTVLQKIILSFLSVFAVILLGLVIWLYSGTWQRPLGPLLQLSTTIPLQMPATWTPDPNAVGTAPSTPSLASTSPISPTATSNASVGLCGAPPVMNILAIGTDARGDNYSYGLADVIRLVRVDFVNPKV